MQHFKQLSIVFTLSLIFILLSSWSVVAAPPQARNFFVKPNPTGILPACTQSDPCKFHVAVNQAAAGDTLYLASGVYTSTGSAVVVVTKSITLYGGWDGAASGLIIRRPSQFNSILDGQGARRGVYIEGQITPTLDGLYITGGNADVASGGGIYADGASPLIRACHLYNNTASEGGGLSFQNSPRTQLLSNLIYNNVALHAGGGGIALNNSPWSTLANNVVRNNEADEYGGGLFVSESPTTTVANNQLFDNIVTQQTGGGIYVDSSSGMMLTVNEIYRNTSLIHGGGLYLANSASVVVEHNQIYSNTVLRDFDGSGGGIGIFTNFTVTVARNQIYQNRAHMGGGLHLQGGITGTVLADNEIYSNTANNGGGLYLSASSHAMLVNNLIHSNRVISYAGGGLFLAGVEDAILLNNVVLNNQLANDSDCGSGILFYESNASLWHTTIANNTGGIGAALCLSYGPSSASLTNTIIANQPIGLFVAGGNTAALDGVLWSGNQLNFGGYGQISVTHAITGAAAFIADGYHLTACSAAINAGLASAVPADIDGQARPLAGASDLGADEFSGGGTCQLVYLPLVLK